MARNFYLKCLVISLLVTVFSLQTDMFRALWADEVAQVRNIQALIDRTVTDYPYIIRLTIHAVPEGEKESRIIACNLREKIGRLSDPEDIEAMQKNCVIVLEEGANIDVTAPVVDEAGRPIAATGITVSVAQGESKQKAVEKALFIARLLNSAISQSDYPLW